MQSLKFEEVIFVINVLDIAHSKGFKFYVVEGELFVHFPDFSANNRIKVSNLLQLVELCGEIIRWE